MAFFPTQDLIAKPVENYVWDAGTMSWVKETQAGGTGGGAVTIADGADVAEGTTTDPAWVSGAGTVISLLKTIASASGGGGGAVTVADGADVAEGAKADVAWSGSGAGSVIAILKKLVSVLGSPFQAGGSIGNTSFIATQATGTNLHVVVDSAPSTAVTNAGLTNLDVALSTRLKPADTLTAVTTVGSITNAVAVTNASLDGTTLSTIDTDLKSNITLHAGTNIIGQVGIDQTLQSVTNGVNVNNVVSATSYGRSRSGTLFGAGGSVGLDLQDGELGTVALCVENTGSFVGTIQLFGIVGAGFSAISQLYNATDNIIESTIQLGKLYQVSTAGFTSVALFVTAYVSGTATFDMYAGSGPISTPKGTQVVSAANLDVALSTRLKPADTLAAVTTVGTVTNPVSTKTDLTPSAPTVATVGVSTASAVAAQATRKGLQLRNLSTSGQRISLGFGSSAVLDNGVTLYPQDGWWMSEYDFDTGTVNAIASAASASLAIQEYLT